MDLAPPPTPFTTSSNNNNNNTKSPEAESTETPARILSSSVKSSPFTNGVLKHHRSQSQNHHHHRHGHGHGAHPPVSQSMAVSYKECLKNHAASLGAHALDGCGEFMPSPSSVSTDPTSLKCAACGCHRNFHRREPEEPIMINSTATHVIEYQPHHRHHPPPPPLPRSPNSASPPPISSSYYPSAPHMLLALSAGLSALPPENAAGAQPINAVATPSPNGRKRFRTKFTHDQKEKMFHFAERVGWRMQKRDEDLIREFCNDVGVERGVLKVWMHNNKNTMGKKPDSNGNGNGNDITTAMATTADAAVNDNITDSEIHNNGDHGGLHMHAGSNGSSSSS